MAEEPGADDGPSIRSLDEATVQRIAAGEVVERPASVVKELVENAIDADASRVSVAVERGGKDGVRVRDDGIGMTESELDLAVRDHHTSKIGDISDLEAGVGTLGFRGEALAAIGAVSRLTVRSKPRGGELGHELTVSGGDIGTTTPAGCPSGTVVEVDDLFYNVPARRKFLKTDSTEFDHVNTVVTQYALANPDVAVSLEHDGREVFATEGNGDLTSTILSVYGREVAEAMVEVEWQVEVAGGAADTDAGSDAPEADGPVLTVSGLVSHPETTRAGREYLSTFVNDRYVTATALREAVLDAYGGQLASDRYPFAVLFVEVDPATVDVNVHPRKMEVRFDDESGVKAAVESAVNEALLSHGLIRRSAPRGRSQADEANVAPGQDGEEASRGGMRGESEEVGQGEEVVGGANTRHERASGAAERRADRESDSTPEKRSGLGTTANQSEPSTTPDGSSRTAEESLDSWGTENGGMNQPAERADESGSRGHSTSTRDAANATDTANSTGATDTANSTGATDTANGTNGTGAAEPSSGSETSEPAATDEADWAVELSNTSTSSDTGTTAGEPATAESENTAGTSAPESERTETPDEGRSFEVPTQQALGGGAAEAGGEYESLPAMRVLGQLHDTYVVAETDEGLVLIDQHAADERVNYERLRGAFADGMTSQALAAPVELELTAREAELFAGHADALSELGFEAEAPEGDESGRTVHVTAVPAVFDTALEPALLQDVLGAFVAGDADSTVEDVADELLADLACYPSVTGNTSLTEGSVSALLSALDDCENPYACPHGRPVIIEISGEEIGERFERDYPGHDGRRQE